MATVAEPKKTLKQTTVVIPDDTTARVSEKIGNKTVSYEAKIEESETPVIDHDDNDTEDTEHIFSNTRLFERESEPVQEIPKSPLEIMFNRVAEMAATGEILYATINRTPDNMTDRYNVPCNQAMSLGIVQFTTNDLFDFIPNIQRLAGNTGGKFNVLVYHANRQPMMHFRQMANGYRDGDGVQVGAQLVIPNPVVDAQPNGAPANNNFDILQIVQTMQDRADARMMQLVESLNKPKEKSEIESLLMQKAMDKLMAEPVPVKDDFSIERTMANIMQSATVMASMGDAFAKMLNREAPPVPEKTWLDQAKEIGELPLVQNVIERIADVAEAAAVNKMQLPAAPNPTPQNTQDEPNEMHELI
jgi:hypothetical protein